MYIITPLYVYYHSTKWKHSDTTRGLPSPGFQNNQHIFLLFVTMSKMSYMVKEHKLAK